MFYTTLSRNILFLIVLLFSSKEAKAAISMSPLSATMCQTGTAQVAFVNGCHHYSSNYPISNLSTITNSGFINILPPSGISYPAVVTFIITGYNADNTVCGTINYSLTVNTGPSFTLSTSTPIICQNQSANIALSGPTNVTYNWNPNNGVYNVSSNMKSVFPETTTVYTVTGTMTGCTSTQNITVTVNPIPVISPNISNITICQNEAAEIKIANSGASVASYSFLPNTNVSNLSSNEYSLNPSTNTVYTLSATSVSGCVSKSKTIQVNINSVPNVAISSSNGMNITSGTSTNLSATGASNYLWACNSTLSSTNSATVIATPISSTTTYTSYGSNGNCTGNASIVINTVSSTESVEAMSTNITPCIGTSTILTANATGSPVSFTWSPSTYLSTTNSMSVVATPSSPITYTVTVQYADGSQVSDILSIVPSSVPSPIITASTGGSPVCPGSDVILSVNPTTGYTYSWSPALNLNSTEGAIVTASPDINTIYTVTATNSNGCSNSDFISLSTFATTPISSNLDDISIEICENDGILLMVEGGASYSWSPANSVSEYLYSENSQVFLTPTTTTNYSVVSTDNNGCEIMANYLVNVRPKPVINILDSVIQVYSGETITLTATGNAASYIWKDYLSDQILGEGSSISTSAIEDKNIVVFGLDSDSKCFDDKTITLDVTTLKTSQVEAGWDLYPNPSEGQFTISADNLADQNFDVMVYDVTGKLVWSEHQNASGFFKAGFDFSNLVDGTYIIRVLSSEGELKSFKWTKI